jgi:hypothetical protein
MNIAYRCKTVPSDNRLREGPSVLRCLAGLGDVTEDRGRELRPLSAERIFGRDSVGILHATPRP